MQLAGFWVSRPNETQLTRAALYAACQGIEGSALINTLDSLRLGSVHVPRPVSRTVVAKILETISRLRNGRIYGKSRRKHPSPGAAGWGARSGLGVGAPRPLRR